MAVFWGQCRLQVLAGTGIGKPLLARDKQGGGFFYCLKLESKQNRSKTVSKPKAKCQAKLKQNNEYEIEYENEIEIEDCIYLDIIYKFCNMISKKNIKSLQKTLDFCKEIYYNIGRKKIKNRKENER